MQEYRKEKDKKLDIIIEESGRKKKWSCHYGAEVEYKVMCIYLFILPITLVDFLHKPGGQRKKVSQQRSPLQYYHSGEPLLN